MEKKTYNNIKDEILEIVQSVICLRYKINQGFKLL